MASYSSRMLHTRRGIAFDVREAGGGTPLVFLHGLTGLLEEERLLDALAEHYHVFAPTWPGFGEEEGEERIEDMLDFSLHGLDILDALELERTHLVGHSLGGMIAAEMACLQNTRIDRLGLLAPFGLWVDEDPIADAFATVPLDLPGLFFSEPEAGQKILTAGFDFTNDEALTNFMVANARRMGTAGKVLFPIPNRRLSKRLYRLTAQTLVVWGSEDALIPPIYAEHWVKRIDRAERVEVAHAGHMLTCERPVEVAEALVEFLGGSRKGGSWQSS